MNPLDNKLLINMLLLFVLMVIAYLSLIKLWPVISQYRIYSITSGSMEPEIGRGSLIVVNTKQAEFDEGSIITFVTPRTGQTLTHRVINKKEIKDKYFYSTQGDGNMNPDPWILSQDDIAGAVVVHLPWVGYLVAVVKTPLGFVVGLVVPTTLLVANEIRLVVMEIRA